MVSEVPEVPMVLLRVVLAGASWHDAVVRRIKTQFLLQHHAEGSSSSIRGIISSPLRDLVDVALYLEVAVLRRYIYAR